MQLSFGKMKTLIEKGQNKFVFAIHNTVMVLYLRNLLHVSAANSCRVVTTLATMHGGGGGGVGTTLKLHNVMFTMFCSGVNLRPSIY